jgi:3-phenylpropionate/cinnamic acid dioxygenase small subunit
MVEQSTERSAMASIEQYHFAARFLAREAKLLDERRFDEWVEMVHEDIVYEVPVRQAKQHFADEFIDGAFRLKDTMSIIKIRIERLRSGHAWAETPPSRTVRVVGSILVDEAEKAGDLLVESALLIYRQRGNADPGDLIPVRRSDVIRISDNGGLLVSRRALIPDTVLQSPNLGIFL